MKRVVVRELGPDGPVGVALTYEAPDDTSVGDLGEVRVDQWWTGSSRTFTAVVTSLESDYSGPCKSMVTVRKAASA